MRLSPSRKILATGAAALGITLGAAGITAAATTSSSSSPPSEQASPEGDQAQEPSYTSSITSPESATLGGLATISAQQAGAAAISTTPGTVGTVNLQNENGNVVFSVEVIRPDGTKLDVKVDAGNAKVLAQQGPDNQTSATDAPDATEPTNSTK
jgi:uncharacterized membrane protein YkoI